MEQKKRKQKQFSTVKALAILVAVVFLSCIKAGPAKAAEQPVSAAPLPTNGQWG